MATAQGLQHPPVGLPAPDFQAMGADGKAHRLSDYAGRIVVLEWTSPVCPYTALKYRHGLMQALQAGAARAGAVWLSVNTSTPVRPGYLTAQTARARVRQTGAQVTEFLLDTDGALGRAYGARTTPQMVVIDRSGVLAYRGALDDDPSRDRPGKGDYVTAALADLSQGRAVRTPEVRPYGCAVEY